MDHHDMPVQSKNSCLLKKKKKKFTCRAKQFQPLFFCFFFFQQAFFRSCTLQRITVRLIYQSLYSTFEPHKVTNPAKGKKRTRFLLDCLSLQSDKWIHFANSRKQAKLNCGPLELGLEQDWFFYFLFLATEKKIDYGLSFL